MAGLASELATESRFVRQARQFRFDGVELVAHVTAKLGFGFVGHFQRATIERGSCRQQSAGRAPSALLGSAARLAIADARFADAIVAVFAGRDMRSALALAGRNQENWLFHKGSFLLSTQKNRIKQLQLLRVSPHFVSELLLRIFVFSCSTTSIDQ